MLKQAHAYVAFNPLVFIDLDRLVLLVCDGTGNDLCSQTNVQHFSTAYRHLSGYGHAQGMRYSTEVSVLAI